MASARPSQRTPPAAVAFAVGGWLVTLAAGAGAVAARVVAPIPIPVTTFGLGDAALVAFVVLAITFASVGALLLVRRPDNAVGPCLVLAGIGYSISMATGVVAFTLLAAGGSDDLALAAHAGWWTVVFSSVGGSALFYLAFIFPTGRGHSRRWEALRRWSVRLAPFYWVWFMTLPGPLHLFPQLDNPFGFGADLRVLLGERSLPIVVGVGAAFIVPLPIAAVATRYRAAGVVERQQLKWFISAAVASMVSLAISAAAVIGGDQALGEAPLVLYGLTGTTVPIAIGIAILRYRLFDIDRLISRTLAYALVSAVLAAAYAVGVLGIGALLGSLAQGGTLAVAASTLLVVAFFGRVRRWAQRVVDRRFDRSRFDAAQALVGLADRLRNDVDADRIEDAIMSAVGETFRPASAGIWLRGGTGGRRPPL